MAIETKKVYNLEIKGADSVNDLKTAIEQLTDKLRTLNQTSQEYKDTLKQLTELQGQLTETMSSAKDVLDAFGETGSEVVESFLTGFVEGMQEAASATTDVNASTIELDDSLTKEAESVKELRDQINGLKDRLVQLNVGSKEYKDTVELLVEKNNKLQSVLHSTNSAVSAATGSYNALSQEMAALRKRWKETSDEAERSQIGKRISEINKELKDMDASIGNYQRNVGNYAGAMKEVFGNPREQIRKLRQELATLEVGSKRYNEVLLEMADLTQRQKHFTDQLRFSSSNLEDIFKNMAGVAAGVVGGFSALNAAMGLFGNQNEDIQKAMLRTQQMIALVQGLNGLAGLKDKVVGLMDGIKGFVSRFGLLNKSTKDFSTQAKSAAGAAQETTGALNSQAAATNSLYDATEKLNEEDREQISIQKQKQADKQAEIELLKTEIDAKEKNLKQNESLKIVSEEVLETQRKEIESKQKLLEEKQKELETSKETEERLTKEAIARAENLSEEEKEIIALQEYAKAKSLQIEKEEIHISSLEDSKKTVDDYVKSLREKIEEAKRTIDTDEEEIEKAEELANAINNISNKTQEYIVKKQQLNKERKEELIATQQDIEARTKYVNKIKSLNKELKDYQSYQKLSIASKKLEIKSTEALRVAEIKRTEALELSTAAKKKDVIQLKAQALAYTTMGVAAKGASMAIKGVKTALISTGIGALLVLLSGWISKLGEEISNTWDEITGVAQARREIEKMNRTIEDTNTVLATMEKYWKALGYTDFKVATHQLYSLSAALKEADKAYKYAANNFKVSSDEFKNARDQWLEATEAYNNLYHDNMAKITQMIQETRVADQQSGWTQLQKDLYNVNQEYADAIELVKQFGREGKLSAEEVDKKVQELNQSLATRRKLLEAAAATATTATTATTKPVGKSKYQEEKEEAEKLYKELLEANKKEEQKLKEKYEKEKKLLEKFHKDTTLLTKKYYEDLDKLLTERQKIEYDKWVNHLNAMLGLEEQNSIKYYEKEIENMQKIFSADFGADENTAFNKLFNIELLDEWGSKAISITDDIAESMKMMGLDPHNIDDIQTMIDKWEADKKAIEDAKKALASLKSEMKFSEFESESDAIDGYIDKMLDNIDFMSEKIQSQSLWKGFYSGLSPEQEQAEFEERYRIIEEELQKELELWETAMNDETLSAEERNKAIQKYNQTMVKQNTYAVQKEIDANNLLIKSFQRVTDAISSMSTNLANILGSVSDMIMDTAQAELDAGKIKEEEYERQFNKAKGIQIAQATINTIAGAVGAFMGITRDTGGWGIAAAAIEAAAVLASGIAQIAVIKNTKPDSTGGSSSTGGGSTTFQLPSVMTPEPTRVQNTTGQDDIDALANALGDQKVYVLESDISRATNKSNKRKTEVTF